MPVELAEKPATISPDKKSTLNTKVLGMEINRGKVVEDEFNNGDITLLEPLTDNYQDSEYVRGLDEALKEDFKYYSRTRKLEVGTESTAVIQDILDKLTTGTNTKTRAVIMNKGRDGVFVTPDGTVFVSQSMINQLGTLDEIAAILAHEVGHLIFETSEKRASTSYHTGTGWVHEAACDTIAPALLERTGFNSRAFSRAILKVSGFERGVIHQGGLTRASESETTHLLIDRSTSAKGETDIPSFLKKWPVENSNVAIVEHMIYERLANLRLYSKNPLDVAFELTEHAGTKIASILNDLNTSVKRLHPRDLKEIHNKLLERLYDRGAYGLLDVCNEVISSRLQDRGYNDSEIKLFLLLEENPDDPHPHRSEHVEESRLFKAKGDIKELAAVLTTLAEDDTKLVRMSSEVFDKPDNKLGDQYKSIATFLNLLEKFLYDENYESKPKGLGIPCDRETLLDTLATISKLNSNDTNPDRQHSVKGWVTTVLNRYINKTYFQFLDERGLTFDEEYIKEFFMEVKSKGIVIDPDHLTRSIEGTDYSYVIKKQIQKENMDVIILSIKEVFGEFVLSEDNINKMVAILTSQEISSQERAQAFSKFLSEARAYLDHKDLSDEERLNLLKIFSNKLKEAEFSFDTPLASLLEESRQESEGDHKSLDREIALFNLNMILTRSFFKEDSESFYKFVEENMQGITPFIDRLSRTQLLNLTNALFIPSSILTRSSNFVIFGQSVEGISSSLRAAEIKNFEKFCNLPLIRKVLSLEEESNFGSIRELNLSAYNSFNKLFKSISHFDIYGDSPISLITGRVYREAFYGLLQQGVTYEQLGDLYYFVNAFYPGGSEKTQFLREINLRFIKSDKFDFNTRLDYALKYFNNVGVEAIIILADEINDIDEYIAFREKVEDKFQTFLEGQIFTERLAVGDFLTASLVRGFDKLLETAKTDQPAKVKSSTDFATEWFKAVISGQHDLQGLTYDPDSKKFILDSKQRSAFKSVKDAFLQLKGLTALQRIALVHKSLTDRGGGLTESWNREKLAKLTVESLGFKGGFIGAVLKEAALHADPKLIAFPLSQILAPLVFRALDISNVDIQKVLKSKTYPGVFRNQKEEIKEYPLSDFISTEDIAFFLNSDSRSISEFGIMYFGSGSSLRLMVQESDRGFLETTLKLQGILNSLNLEEGKEKSDIDESVEAVIKGVERSGALGIRALQLATQFYRFEGNLGKRLSESLDSNPGLNKLLFWENLHKLSQEDGEIRDFVSRIKLGNYIGGGSLQTTFSATLINEDGSTRPIVIKMKNPNVEAFIKDSYKSATTVLEFAKGLGFGKNARHARIGLSLIDLAQKWCLDDINDQTFLEDDALFASKISAFNEKEEKNTFYMPEKLLTTSKVKSEDLAPGKTVNQFLSDESVSEGQKREVVEILSRFFSSQFRREPYVGEDGKQFYLIHSDPHIGNYIVDVQNGEFKIGVIDRSMYLKVSPEDVKALEGLINRGNDNAFVYGFVERLLDINKVRGINRAVITAKILNQVYGEYVKQKVTGKVDRLSLMISMSSTAEGAKLDIPLHLRLMIRNIAAFQELGRRYGVNFETLYREAA